MGCRGPFALEGSRSMSAKPRPADGAHARPCRTTKDAPRCVKCCRARVHQRTHQFLLLARTWPLTHTRGRATATARPSWRCVKFTICGPHFPPLNITFRTHPAAYAMLSFNSANQCSTSSFHFFFFLHRHGAAAPRRCQDCYESPSCARLVLTILCGACEPRRG